MKRHPPDPRQTELAFLSLDKARKNKESILEQVYLNNRKWHDAAMIALEAMIYALPAEFLGEVIRQLLTPIVGRPRHPNCWGAFIGLAIKREVIVPLDRFAPTRGAPSHASQTRLYRAGVLKRAAA